VIQSGSRLWPEADIHPLAETFDAAAVPLEDVVLTPPMRLGDFVRDGWHVLEPGTAYRHGWHIDAVCEHLEAVAFGQIRNLLITIPPGHMKSLIVSVFWPAWMWSWRATWRGIFSSYDSTLAIRDSTKTRQLLDSPWFKETFQPAWRFSTDQNVKSYFQNTQMGFRLSLHVGGGTGYRGDATVVDDPMNAMDRYSDEKRKRVINWWDTTMSSRFSNQETGSRIIIAQRLHQEDLPGHVIAKGEYEHLNLPSEYEPARAAKTSIGWSDPRTTPGELLFPALFPRPVLEQAKKDLGSLDYAAQHQQDPGVLEGSLFKRNWWKYYDAGDLPRRFDVVVLSLDCNFKETADGSFVVFQLWGKKGSNLYLLGQIRLRIDFPKTIAAFQWVVRIEPRLSAKYVEDKANGPAVIASLKQHIPGIVPISAETSYVARWAASSPYVEAGNLWLPTKASSKAWTETLRSAALDPAQTWIQPHEVSEDWVSEFVDEHAHAPTGRYDDQVDAQAQVTLKLLTGLQPKEDLDPKNWGVARME